MAWPAAAQPQGASGAATPDRKAAREKFQEGEQAFAAGEFARAGSAFEAAHRLAPHPSALWNAARAWHRAGDAARAANLYGRYLRESPPDASDRPAAGSAFAELSAKVGRIEVSGRDLTDIRVDEQPIDGTSTYVNPGTHLVRARSGGRDVSKLATAEVGAVVQITLGDEGAATPAPPATAPTAAATPAPAATTAPTSGTKDAPERTERDGWSPIVVIVGAGATVFAGSWTIWSGFDTLQQKKTFDEERSQANLDEGKKRQLRTNLLIGTTAVLGTLTGLAAVFLVDWGGKSKSKTQVGVGPGSVAVRGSF